MYGEAIGTFKIIVRYIMGVKRGSTVLNFQYMT